MPHNVLENFRDILVQQFSDDIYEEVQDYDFQTVFVSANKIKDIIRFMHDNDQLQFQFLTTMCVIHYPEKEGEEFCVMYQFHNLPKNIRVRLKTFIPVANPIIDSVTDIFLCANWMERECFDFYGVQFTGHPNLKRILNMEDMDYFPMRKEYPLEDQKRLDKVDTSFGR